MPKLTALGVEVAVERGAGQQSSFTDDAYEEAGAQLVDTALDADIVAKVAPPSAARGRSADGATPSSSASSRR